MSRGKSGEAIPRSGIIGTTQGQGVYRRGRLHTGAVATPICRPICWILPSFVLTGPTMGSVLQPGTGVTGVADAMIEADHTWVKSNK